MCRQCYDRNFRYEVHYNDCGGFIKTSREGSDHGCKLSRTAVQLRTYMDTEVFIYGPVMRGRFLKMKGGEANCVLHWIALCDILEIKFCAQGCLWEKNRRTGNSEYGIWNSECQYEWEQHASNMQDNRLPILPFVISKDT